MRDSSQPSWAWHEAARTGIALSPQGPSISLAFDVPAEYADTQQDEVPPTHRGSAITMLDYTGSP